MYRELNEADSEKATLKQIVGQTSDSLPSLDRLIEIARKEQDFESMRTYAEQYLAIQPLIPLGHVALADASEHLDSPEIVVESLSALAMMEPIDPAALDYRKATALAKMNRNLEAKRSVLEALDEAPRFRDAHRLLLELETGSSE